MLDAVRVWTDGVGCRLCFQQNIILRAKQLSPFVWRRHHLFHGGESRARAGSEGGVSGPEVFEQRGKGLVCCETGRSVLLAGCFLQICMY